MQSLLGALVLAACATGPAERAASPEGATGFWDGEPEVRLSTDSRFVLRQRLGPGSAVAAGEPFAHRGRRWSVYPFTLYPGARVEVRLRVTESMADRAALWIFGPMRQDGSWGAPLRFETIAGTADAPVEAPVYGQYAAVVGPAERTGFEPRYPSSLVRLTDASGRELMGQIDLEGTPKLYTEDGGRWEIVGPLPANEPAGDPSPGDVFELRGGDGATASLTIRAWSSSSWFMPHDGAEFEDAILGNLDGLGRGILALNPTSDSADEQRALVLDALSGDGRPSTSPAILRVVPDTVGGRTVIVTRTGGCDGPGCAVALFADDGSEVPDSEVRSLLPTYWDFDERSTYDLEIDWGPATPAAGGIHGGLGETSLPRFPVYFAHGFNSSAEVWTPLFESLRAQDDRWTIWAGAADVAPFEPVPARAEQLRRNIEGFLGRLEPHAGEPILRVNVVAHSMGGLDARWLVGAEQYNERCGELLCSGEAGEPEPCCPLDTRGRPLMWRDRIASLTTLGSPHCGSSFADTGISLLGNRLVDFAFRMVASKYFGLDAAGQDRMIETFRSLSRPYCRQTMDALPRPTPGRSYSWACATGQESCATAPLAAADAPVPSADRPRLPAPAPTTTVFSWASVTCLTGNCGDVLDPGLLLPHLAVMRDEGDNDGVVSTASARFGIYMGVRSNDHFHWNRSTYGAGASLLGRLFGVRPEPADRFHGYWLGELARAGY